MSTLNAASVDNNVEADILWARPYIAAGGGGGGAEGAAAPARKTLLFFFLNIVC